MDTNFGLAMPGSAYMAPAVQSATPTTGQTVAMVSDSTDRTLYLTPAGPLLALTVTLPSEANSRIGQIVRIVTRQAVTTLAINGATTIVNGVATLVANDAFAYQKVAANTWIRV